MGNRLCRLCTGVHNRRSRTSFPGTAAECSHQEGWPYHPCCFGFQLFRRCACFPALRPTQLVQFFAGFFQGNHIDFSLSVWGDVPTVLPCRGTVNYLDFFSNHAPMPYVRQTVHKYIDHLPRDQECAFYSSTRYTRERRYQQDQVSRTGRYPCEGRGRISFVAQPALRCD